VHGWLLSGNVAFAEAAALPGLFSENDSYIRIYLGPLPFTNGKTKELFSIFCAKMAQKFARILSWLEFQNDKC
jgi:hypothetical protein